MKCGLVRVSSLKDRSVCACACIVAWMKQLNVCLRVSERVKCVKEKGGRS